jgi:putative ABC transport system permease protein
MLGNFFFRLRALFHRHSMEKELDAELRAHIEHQTEKYIKSGMSPEEAARRARLEFGGIEQIKEDVRDGWGVRFISELAQDLRHGLRQLRRNPGFTVVAVLTLALGIGVNTSVFSFLDAVALRSLTVPRANRVVVVRRGDATRFSYPHYVNYRDGNHSFTALAATFPTEATLDFEGQSEPITAEAVSANYETVMRIPLFLGHWFTNEDEPEAVISYRAWMTRFHSDPKVLGKQVRSISEWYTVVGVAPRDFTGVFAPDPTELWVPLRYWAKPFPGIVRRFHDPSNPTVMIFGRLGNGVSAEQATANLRAIDTQIPEPNSETRSTPLTATIVQGAPDTGNRNQLMPIIWLFAGVALLVLLIACANIGNLILARGSARQREIAIRVALGAGRLRVVRQLMTETFLLALMGGAGGLTLATWTDHFLESLSPAMLIRVSLRLSIDARIVGFTLLLTLLTMFLLGLLPAWHTSRSDVYAALKGDNIPPRQFQLRQVSLVAQVAICLLLLVCAGLFVRSIVRLRDVNPGFAVKNRLYAWTFISPPDFTRKTGPQFYKRAVERLRYLPGVRNAGLVHFLPLVFDDGSDCVSSGGAAILHVTHGTIGPGYLKTMEIPLLDGRDFSAEDGPGSPSVVIANETLASRFWPHQNAVGRRILIGCKKPETAEVVGVTRDSKVLSLSDGPRPYFYRPFSQNYTGLATIVIQTDGNPRTAMPTVRRALLDLSKSVRIYALNTVAYHVDQSYWKTRWISSLLVIFALLALGLAAVGLHGVIAYWATLRTHEIGIRMALGAEKGDVFRMVIGQGLRLALIGVAIGIAGALALTRFLSSLLYGVKPTDPPTFIAVSLILIAVALLACYIPARRAAKVDPMVALRYE